MLQMNWQPNSKRAARRRRRKQTGKEKTHVLLTKSVRKPVTGCVRTTGLRRGVRVGKEGGRESEDGKESAREEGAGMKEEDSKEGYGKRGRRARQGWVRQEQGKQT